MRYTSLISRYLVCVGWLLVAISHAANAQSLARSEDDEGGWRHSITPYLFLPLSTTGTSTIDGTSVDLDLSLSEVLDVLQGAASVRYEGWNGDFGIISEVYYVRLGEDGTLPGGRVDVDVDVRQTFVNVQGAYRFANGVNASGRRYAADAAIGVQWNRLKQEIDLSGPGPGMTLGGTEDWFEPMIALRYAMEINDKWSFASRAELSGFGVNGDDLQYLLLAGFDWKGWENTSLRFGYQFYGIDYSTDRSGGEFAYDVDQNGIYAAVAFHF
ncbi:OprO/OprP family phosphate-selective porin [Ruegeria conchae]|uniref:OprO/OprP family phosphate-selective porin n=1 Tax=Ruegeria conchae TaxID=981384 RepID=UPI0021A4C8B8|nr:OprO/OprP family phosphate-selective porin [Ruegeria conchae]UWR03926.1 OprO/OprP family phosphate-selective porin [Ruegeria conchae]